ncbi:MAG: sulfotransferase [Schleiferiaceae bacterium]|nr:sulfotransferase [Schleiferiaceae bacterium]
MQGVPFPQRWFIHIGHHKTGTSWMQQVLFTKEHGFCVLNNHKEPWKDALLRALVLGEGFEPDRVRALVRERWDSKGIPVITAERLSGHPMSGGFDQKTIANRLYAAFPEAIVLVGTRDPEEAKSSVYKQLIREGFLGKDLQALEATDWKVPQIRDAYFHHALLLRHYRSLFPADQVVELPYAKLQESPIYWIEALEKASGQKFSVVLSNGLRRRINTSWSDRRTRVQRVANYFGKSPLNPYPLIRLNKRLARIIAEVAVLFGA